MSSSSRRQSRGRAGRETDAVASSPAPAAPKAAVAASSQNGSNTAAPVTSARRKGATQPAAPSEAATGAVAAPAPSALQSGKSGGEDESDTPRASQGARSRSSSGARSRSRAPSDARAPSVIAPPPAPAPAPTSKSRRSSASGKATSAPPPQEEEEESDTDDFEPAGSEGDEETTLIEQEKHEGVEDAAEEVAALEKEANMDIEQLRAMYAALPADDDEEEEEEEGSHDGEGDDMEEDDAAPPPTPAPPAPDAPPHSKSRASSRRNSEAGLVPETVAAAPIASTGTPSNRSRTASIVATGAALDAAPPHRAPASGSRAPSALSHAPVASGASPGRPRALSSAAAALPAGVKPTLAPTHASTDAHASDVKPAAAHVPTAPVVPSVSPPMLLPVRSISAATDDASIATSAATGGAGKAAAAAKRKPGIPQGRDALWARRNELLHEILPLMADDTTEGRWLTPTEFKSRHTHRSGVEADMYATAEVLEAADTVQGAGVDTSFSITSLGEPPSVGGYVLAANPSGTASLDVTINAASAEARMDVLRPKLQWDYLLDEMTWLASDVYHERERKVRQAKRLAQAVMKYFERKVKKMVEDAQLEQQRARRRAARIAQNVGKFWAQVDKLVIFKHRSRLDAIRRMALDKHLNFLVGQTERYAALLAAQVSADGVDAAAPAASAAAVPTPVPLLSDSKHEAEDNQDADDDAMGGEDDALVEEEAAGAGDTSLGEMLNGDSDEEEDDFSMDSNASGAVDDEETIEAEEAVARSRRKRARVAETASADAHEHGENDLDEDDAALGDDDGDDDQDELAALQDEANLPIDELMRRHGLLAADSNVADSMVQLVSSDKTADVSTSEAPRTSRRRRTEGAPTSAAIVVRHEAPPPPQHSIAIPYLFRRGELLRPYQRDGLDWLVSMHDRRLNGILADEMGLGKTIQTISLLAHLAAARCVWGPHLIVVPTSTILNWEMEFRRWCPALKVITYFGSVKERKIKRLGWTKSNAFHVVITSYQMVLADAAIFRRKHWYYLILDEAHYIKNYQSQRWQTLLTFASRRRLLLTGTPLQNSLMELWSLMHFLMPHLFRSQAEFKQWFSNPLTQHVEGGPSVDPVLVRRLHAVLRPFVLRRLKSEVAKQMPKKYEHVVMCRLSQRQRFLYEDFMSRSSTRAALSGASFMSMMNVLMQLRKVCNHPDLFEPRPIVSPMELPLILYSVPRVAVDARTLTPSRLADAVTLTGDACVAVSRSWSRSLDDAHLLQLALYAPMAVLALPDDAARGTGMQASILSPFVHTNVALRETAAASNALSVSNTGRNCSFFARKQICVSAAGAREVPAIVTRLLTGTLRDDADALRAQALTSAISAALLDNFDNVDDASSAAFASGVSLIHGIVHPILGATTGGTVPAPTMVTSATVDSHVRAIESRDGFSADVERAIASKLAAVEAQTRARFNSMRECVALEALHADALVDSDFVEGEPTMGALLLAPLSKFARSIILLHAARRARARCVQEQQLRAAIALNDLRCSQPHQSSRVSHLLEKLSIAPVSSWMTACTPDTHIAAILTHAVHSSLNDERGLRTPPVFTRGAVRGGMCDADALARPEHVVMLSSLAAAPSCATASRETCERVIRMLTAATYFAVPELSSHDDDKRRRRGLVGGAPPSPAAWWTYSDTLRGMVRSLSETYTSLQPALQRFVFFIPKAVARQPRMLSSLPPREHARAYRLSQDAVVQTGRMINARLHDVCVRQSLSFPDRRLIQFDCGKLQALANLLRDRKAGGHRCLIFTQMSRMLDVLETFLNLHHHTYLRLDGSTKVEERQRLMERFNRDERMFVFILSTRSGGLGINLVGADTVIFYDSDWNPAMDAQAQDRAHRIGQTRDVHIYRLVSESTIEENILLKARQKRHLSHLSLEEGNFTVDRLVGTDGGDGDELPRTWMPEDAVGDATARLVDAAAATLGGDGDTAASAVLSRDVVAALEAAEDDADRAASAKAHAEVRAEMAEFDEASNFKVDSSAAADGAEDDDMDLSAAASADGAKVTDDDGRAAGKPSAKNKRKKARRGLTAAVDEDDESDDAEAASKKQDEAVDPIDDDDDKAAGKKKGKRGVHFADDGDTEAVGTVGGKPKRTTRAASRKSNLDIDLEELQRQTTEEQERVAGDDMDISLGAPLASASAAGRSSAQTLFDSALASSRGTTTPTAPTRDRVAIALAKFGEIQSKLREAERYALGYRELHDPHPWVEPSLLKALEDQFESEEKEWELEQLEAMKADDESKAEADAELLQLSRVIGGVVDPVAAGQQVYETTLRSLRRGIRVRAVSGTAWQQRMDEVKRLPYYFNIDTKEAVWERPIVLRKADARKSASRSRWQEICTLPATAVRIMRFLQPMERAQVASHVCRHWRSACTHPTLYKFVRLRGAHELLQASRHPADAPAAAAVGSGTTVFSDLGDALAASVHGDTIVVGFGSHYVDHPLRVTQRVRILSQGVQGAAFAGFDSPDDEWICGPSGEWYPNLGCVPPSIAARMNLVSSLRSDADATPLGAPLSSSCTVADSAVVRVNGAVTWVLQPRRMLQRTTTTPPPLPPAAVLHAETLGYASDTQTIHFDGVVAGGGQIRGVTLRNISSGVPHCLVLEGPGPLLLVRSTSHTGGTSGLQGGHGSAGTPGLRRSHAAATSATELRTYTYVCTPAPLQVLQCDLGNRGGRGACVSITSGATLIMSACRIAAGSGSGIHLDDGGSASVLFTELAECGGSGVNVVSGVLSLVRSRVRACGGVAVRFSPRPLSLPRFTVAERDDRDGEDDVDMLLPIAKEGNYDIFETKAFMQARMGVMDGRELVPFPPMATVTTCDFRGNRGGAWAVDAHAWTHHVYARNNVWDVGTAPTARSAPAGGRRVRTTDFVSLEDAATTPAVRSRTLRRALIHVCKNDAAVVVCDVPRTLRSVLPDTAGIALETLASANSDAVAAAVRATTVRTHSRRDVTDALMAAHACAVPRVVMYVSTDTIAPAAAHAADVNTLANAAHKHAVSIAMAYAQAHAPPPAPAPAAVDHMPSPVAGVAPAPLVTAVTDTAATAPAPAPSSVVVTGAPQDAPQVTSLPTPAAEATAQHVQVATKSPARAAKRPVATAKGIARGSESQAIARRAVAAVTSAAAAHAPAAAAPAASTVVMSAAAASPMPTRVSAGSRAASAADSASNPYARVYASPQVHATVVAAAPPQQDAAASGRGLAGTKRSLASASVPEPRASARPRSSSRTKKPTSARAGMQSTYEFTDVAADDDAET